MCQRETRQVGRSDSMTKMGKGEGEKDKLEKELSKHQLYFNNEQM